MKRRQSGMRYLASLLPNHLLGPTVPIPNSPEWQTRVGQRMWFQQCAEGILLSTRPSGPRPPNGRTSRRIHWARVRWKFVPRHRRALIHADKRYGLSARRALVMGAPKPAALQRARSRRTAR